MWVNSTACGDTTTKLFKGADGSVYQQVRGDILTYLKDSKSQKLCLKEEKPDLWKMFGKLEASIWYLTCHISMSTS
jgi:hypothetical protein